METIEGLHYIFDRYTFLNNIMEENNRTVRITADSPTDRIRKAIKLARALYHPDRQENSAKDMKQKAERATFLLSDCATFLLNDNARPLYNQRLQQFQQDKPDFVSTSGTPIIDIYSENFEVDSLLADDVIDTKAYESRAKDMLHFDEANFNMVASLYKSMPDNQDMRAVYRNMLTVKYVYVCMLENAAWQKLGFSNRKKKAEGWVTDAQNYLNQVEKVLEATKATEIPAMLQKRDGAARIGFAPMPLLLSYNDASGAAVTQNYALMKPEEQADIIAKMTEKARSNFDGRSDYVRAVAQQKQDVLAELVTLTPVKSLTDCDPADPIHHLYLVEQDDDALVNMRLILDTNTGNATPEPLETASLTAFIATGLKANSHAVYRNKELAGEEFLLEISAAAERIFAQIQQQTKDTPASTPTPKPSP